jgi:hypothetical protein
MKQIGETLSGAEGVSLVCQTNMILSGKSTICGRYSEIAENVRHEYHVVAFSFLFLIYGLEVSYLYKRAIIITNNCLVKESEGSNSRITIDFVDGGLLEVLTKARDYIHKGHILLTHPLMGSIKPNETPYKSVAVSVDSDVENQVDFDSLMYMEQSVETSLKMLRNKPLRVWPESVLEDFRVIDYDLIKNAINN